MTVQYEDKRNKDRAQTAIDFGIALTALILILGALFALTSGPIWTDFTNEADTRSQAQHLSNYLIQHQLADDDAISSNALDEQRVSEFFDEEPPESEIHPIAVNNEVHISIEDSSVSPRTHPILEGETLEYGDSLNEALQHEVETPVTIDGKQADLVVRVSI